jgi:predicted dehydrogenase
MRRVKVGVVGLGEVAQIVHLPILQQLADRFEIAALCDVSPGLLRAVGERYGVERRYTKAAELAVQPDLDSVLVLNSDEYHADHTIAALRNGKHVLVEKPMCLTLREADEIIQARDDAGVQVMVAYMRRFAPAFVQAVEEVKRLPKINYARVRDIIGRNRLVIDQSSVVLRFDDVPAAAPPRRRARSGAPLVAARVAKPSSASTVPKWKRMSREIAKLSLNSAVAVAPSPCERATTPSRWSAQTSP